MFDRQPFSCKAHGFDGAEKNPAQPTMVPP
jgi:hypothetical protein